MSDPNRKRIRKETKIKALLSNDYKLWHKRMIRIAAKAGVARNRREDLIHEAALKMMERWKESTKPVGEWLALSGKMVHDLAVDLIRSINRRNTASLDAESVELIDAKAVDPAEMAETKELYDGMAAKLEELSRKRPNHAWLLREHYLKKRSIKELAEERGATEHAIHCRMTRALQAMRSRMSEYRPDDEAAS